MTSWFVCLSTDQVARVQALAGGHCVVLLDKTLNSKIATFHSGV